jgi:hypothetical protein
LASLIRASRTQQRVSSTTIQAVVVPLVVGLIGAGATLAAPIIGNSTSQSSSTTSSGLTTVISPSGGVTIQGAGSNSRFAECVIYDEGFVVPLARINYKMAETLLNSRSIMDRVCGLSP